MGSRVGNQGLMNLNGHVMCSIDTETTGLTPGKHDIIEFACVPLDADLRPMDVVPFHTTIRPKMRFPDSVSEEAMNVNGLKIDELLMSGLEPFRAAELFEQWVENLQLAPYKKIAPLGKNWPFDRGFINDWLGPLTTDSLFWHRYRDLSPVALYLNDKAEFDAVPCPFPQTGLGEIRNSLKLPPVKQHRALDDALSVAECYRAMLKGW